MKQIIIKCLDKPQEKNIDQDIEWISDSFGLCSGRDIDCTANKILDRMLKRLPQQERIPSESIAEELHISQGMVNHHIRSMVDSGMIYREKKLILLRGGSLRSAVESMRKDVNRAFEEITTIAEELDQSLGFRNR